jgi:ubiquinone/menaquinone biosynthesis C-methylase UbiE
VSFLKAFAHQLPFESDTFDLVIAWSVLHWIGRNEYLQSLGELIRVCKKYLVIMDFSAKEDYRVPYKHKEGLYTYKHDFEITVTSSGVMRAVKVIRFYVNPRDKKIVIVNKQQLEDFESVVNYHSRKLVIFEKNYDLLQCKEESDFN